MSHPKYRQASFLVSKARGLPFLRRKARGRLPQDIMRRVTLTNLLDNTHGEGALPKYCGESWQWESATLAERRNSHL